MDIDVSYDKEKLLKLRDEILNKIMDLNEKKSDDDFIYGVPYIVTLIDRLLYDDYEAIREVARADISKERFPIKSEIKKIIKELQSKTLDLEEKIELTEELKGLYTELVHEEEYLSVIMKYYKKLWSLISLKEANVLSKKIWSYHG